MRVRFGSDGPSYELAESLVEACRRTVEAMREGGLVEPADELVVVTALACCEAVEADPLNAAMFGQLIKAVELLRGLARDEGISEAERLITALSAKDRDSTP